MPCRNCVRTWRHSFDREATVVPANGKERMIRNADVGLHPGVLITLHGNENLSASESLFNGRCSVWLGLVPLRIVFRSRVDVVLRRIAVSNLQLLVCLDAQHVWPVMAAVLIKRYSVGRSGKRIFANLCAICERAVLDIDKCVGEFAIANHGILGR